MQPTMELATEQNFHPWLYMVVNPDLMEAHRKDRTFDAAAHFHLFGIAEKRMQLSAAVPVMMREKYPRFQPILDAEKYSFLGTKDCFPLISQGLHFSLESYVAESANVMPNVWAEELRNNPDKLYLDLGAGLRDLVFKNCLYLEVYPSVTADIIMTPNTPLPFHAGSIDGLGCFSVMEHVPDPFALAREIKRVLKPGGRLFIDWPFLQPFHGYPSHYYNATAPGLRQIFEDAFEIECVEAFEYQSADSTLSWILKWFVDGLTEGALKERFLSMSVAELNAQPAKGEFYRACLDIMSSEMKMKLACGNTLIGWRKTD
jgi:hypothetical protein